MAVPATQGRLCTSLQEMEIGDYIQWHYKADSANVVGEFTDISSGGGMKDSI